MLIIGEISREIWAQSTPENSLRSLLHFGNLKPQNIAACYLSIPENDGVLIMKFTKAMTNDIKIATSCCEF